MKNNTKYKITLNLNEIGIYGGLTDRLWLSDENVEIELSYLDENTKKNIVGYGFDRPNMLRDIANLYAEYFNEITNETWVVEPTKYDVNYNFIDEITISCFTNNSNILKKLLIIEDKIKKMKPNEFETNNIYLRKSGFSLLQNHIQWLYENKREDKNE